MKPQTFLPILGLALSPLHAALYVEDFEVVGSSLGSQGWTAVKSDASDLSGSFGISTSSPLDGARSAFASGSWAPVWMVSDAPTITVPVGEVSFLSQTTASTWRIGLEVGGTWYLSGEVNAASAGGAVTVDDFSTGFAAWGAGTSTTGAPDGIEAWDLSTLGTAGALPTGNITGVGLMGVNNLSVRFDNVTVTAVPEPAATLLGSLGLLALLRRRR